MKTLYLQVLNEQSDLVWIKFILKQYNEIVLTDLVKSLNQYLINTNAKDVFFDSPNILFEKVNYSLYRSNNDKNLIKQLTTEDHTPVFTQSFSSYYSFKDAIINLLLKKEEKVKVGSNCND